MHDIALLCCRSGRWHWAQGHHRRHRNNRRYRHHWRHRRHRKNRHHWRDWHHWRHGSHRRHGCAEPRSILLSIHELYVVSSRVCVRQVTRKRERLGCSVTSNSCCRAGLAGTTGGTGSKGGAGATGLTGLMTPCDIFLNLYARMDT